MLKHQPIITEPDLRRLKSLPLDEQLAAELERAIVVPSDEVPEDVVTMGSRVVFVDETTGRRRYLSIVDPLHADVPQLEVSVLAPVVPRCSDSRSAEPLTGDSRTARRAVCASLSLCTSRSQGADTGPRARKVLRSRQALLLARPSAARSQ